MCIELDKSAAHQKAICLQYMNPWLKNFNKFCDPTNKLFELSGARLRDCIRLLLDLTVKDADVRGGLWDLAAFTDYLPGILHHAEVYLGGDWNAR